MMGLRALGVRLPATLKTATLLQVLEVVWSTFPAVQLKPARI
jgi:hypothetical protein